MKKLGIKPGFSIAMLGVPHGYARTLGVLPRNVTFAKSLRGGLDFIHFFAARRKELEARFATLAKALAPAGMLWVSWPKKAAEAETDLDENVVREVGLAHGLVDVKVCAVDETWSGLKFVRRLRDRRRARRPPPYSSCWTPACTSLDEPGRSPRVRSTTYVSANRFFTVAKTVVRVTPRR